MEHDDIIIFTDGSCHPACQVGGWAAIILTGEDKIILKGTAVGTTHQRMELTAVMKAMEHLESEGMLARQISVYTDSQYVVNLRHRKEKLKASNFLTKKGWAIQNADLLRVLMKYIEYLNIEFIKVKAHQKSTSGPDFNREVDKLSRKMVRQYVKRMDK